MSIRFKYKTIQRPDGSRCKGPWISVIVKGHKEAVELIFLLDSGADFTVIPIEIAEILGLDMSNPVEKSGGVGGEVDTTLSSMEIDIKNAHENYRFRIPVQILMNKDSKIPPLLGRAGFFSEFEIKIKQKAGRFALKKEQDKAY